MRMASTILLLSLLGTITLTGRATHAADLRNGTPTPIVNTPSSESDVDNGNGTWTFTQVISSGSTAPHYTGPFSTYSSCASLAGFDYYSWYDQDYGWQHNFPHWSDANLTIHSATLTITAWDVDSEPEHGLDGEYDGIHVDGTLLNPGYLQGTNGTWSVTSFDVPLASFLDDGLVHVFMNIDMNHTSCWWATTLDHAELRIVYSTTQVNHPPLAPQMSMMPHGCPTDADNLVATIIGPTPADPDGDAVTYSYRWFVDVGTGSYLDDEFAGRGDHVTNVVPSADTQVGDRWRVQVTPTDEHGAIGPFSTFTYTGPVGGVTPAVRSTWGALKAMFR